MPLRHRELMPDLALPIELQPFQSIDDGVDGRLRGPRAVGILDAQQELAAGVVRIKPVEQRGARSADMQKARR